MVIPVFILVVGLVTLIGAAALVLWQQVLDWTEKQLSPWVEQHLPLLKPYLASALVAADRLAVALRRPFIEAWQKLRPYVLQITVDFEQAEHHRWLVKITSYLQAHLGPAARPSRNRRNHVGRAASRCAGADPSHQPRTVERHRAS